MLCIHHRRRRRCLPPRPIGFPPPLILSVFGVFALPGTQDSADDKKMVLSILPIDNDVYNPANKTLHLPY